MVKIVKHLVRKTFIVLIVLAMIKDASNPIFVKLRRL